MKQKTITLKINGASAGQWSNLLLELNLIKKAWRPYKVDIQLHAQGLKNVLKWGTKIGEQMNLSGTKKKKTSHINKVFK
jgi:hypothetical protein|tara:strand:+ start:975 stop:1211 length:237 start_codon:yes stop_codon:yes gene_type:complete